MAICGIVGLWHRDKRGLTQELDGMLDMLRHRGPDGEGRFAEQHISLGMRRLAIRDVLHGNQPYRSEDGMIVAVFNGEIYNYPQLKRDLLALGHQLNSDADGEVLVHLYEEYGVDFLERISGMFAIALWDQQTRELILARDRVGQKPLYVWDNDKTLGFSSELKAFLALDDFHPEVDPRIIPAYLAYRFVPSPMTLFRQVTKLRPGEVMRIRPDGRRERWRYWQPAIDLPDTDGSLDLWADRLEALLTDVVGSHLASDVPLGIFLSGGLDSSVLAALTAIQHTGPVEAFSAVFPPSYPGYDEYGFAEKVAQKLGWTIHRVEVASEITPDRIRELAFILDEPMADPTVLPLDGLARAAAERETVMISGEGADEIFGGYAGYGEVAALARLRKIPPALRQWWISHGWRGTGALNRAGQSVAERYRGVGFTFSPAERLTLGVPEAWGTELTAPIREYWAQARDLPELQAMQGFDVQWFLPDDVLVKADRIGMHHNLEIRVPYCDHDVVNLALKIPLALRRQGREDKRVLRRVAERHLPADIVYRPKRGFPTPLTRLLTEQPLYDFTWQVLTDPAATRRGWFNPDAVTGLLQRLGSQPTSTVARQVYALLMLELWINRMVDGRRQRMWEKIPHSAR
ncbi:asparagine synthase (glutamine-hydrolyzing) [Sulfobacillus acidophilus TPY]|uniref:asparagine synthase (glutamine-hydrolyzing) n=1 Tax=Sulfobacillus acidophilus (strain ATCC 700253 / DSM 10332 / NAL) TaxID=679936 RepID=G8TZP3_SULAD|nr:asparagine synthase (glutamine-hydrolyzing) [Sulfobacillus acidophilus TPY]AEW06373.1 asparagine synthase (glutamine-hydrolyzing) [Sulfobacillus acidophilus DSM 10332]